MTAYLEHANITVPDIDAAIAFLKVVEPAFKVRHDGMAQDGYRWVHIGTDSSYIALQEPHSGPAPANARPAYQNYGVNHLAWVVDDIAAVVRRLEARGYRKGMVEDHSHRKRAYYFDTAGFEWEFLQYLSEDPAQRNSYT